MTRTPATWIIAGVLASGLGVGAVGIASAAQDASPTPSASASASPGPNGTDAAKAPKKQKGLLARALHGDAVVRAKGGTYRTVSVQRGEITAVSATSLTLKSMDGFSRTYVVGATTKVREKGAEKTIAELTTGERAMVTAERTGDSWTASKVACVHEKAAAPATN